MKLLKIFTVLLFTSSILSAQNDPRQLIEDWPEISQKAAKAMLEKYGEPDEHTKSMLIWEDQEPFTHIIVYKEEIQHDFPMPHKDVLEHIIHYDVPADKFDDLAEFDGSVIVERTRGIMAARCDKEAANLLALNLANDVIQNKRTVEEARDYYADAIMKMLQGEKLPYVKELTFDLPQENITNTDVTTMDMSKVKELKNK